MIKIDRSKVDKPSILTDSANTEHEKARVHYIDNGLTKAFNHKLYKHTTVKKALEDLFNGKCAYCESNVIITSAIDKEHFRPKTSVKNKETGDEQRGYYWLAAEWDNLLLACGHCNRTGTHKDEFGEDFVSGKLDYFPLEDETKRALNKDGLIAEEAVRLIINPCIDNPESLIKYNDYGEILAVEDLSDIDTKKVHTSIDIFGLNRSTLHKERKEKISDIRFYIMQIKEAYDDYIESPKSKYIERIKKILEQLNKQLSKDKPYLGPANLVVKEEFKELRALIAGLEITD